jgi:holo-[acyl-carrier protein] synthase
MPLRSSRPSYLIVVHGIDVVDVQEYARILHPAMKPHLKTMFTAQELEECGDNERTAQRLAGRFAVKEAVLKALGLPFGDGVAFLDIETVTVETGAPTVVTHRKVNELAAELGVQNWLVSTSHTSTIAVASVIGVRPAAAS